MDLSEEWRRYDPSDIRTHPEPESGPAVEIEAVFDDGQTIRGDYLRDGGWFSRKTPGTLIADAQIVRWRYTR